MYRKIRFSKGIGIIEIIFHCMMPGTFRIVVEEAPLVLGVNLF